jgi:hypothetical protein
MEKNKLYVKFEDLNDVDKTIDTFLNIFRYLTEFYAKEDSDKLETYLYKINAYFYTFYYLYTKLLLTDYEEDNDEEGEK